MQAHSPSNNHGGKKENKKIYYLKTGTPRFTFQPRHFLSIPRQGPERSGTQHTRLTAAHNHLLSGPAACGNSRAVPAPQAFHATSRALRAPGLRRPVSAAQQVGLRCPQLDLSSSLATQAGKQEVAPTQLGGGAGELSPGWASLQPSEALAASPQGHQPVPGTTPRLLHSVS